MKIYWFKSSQIFVIGFRYSKNLYVDGEHIFIISLGYRDLDFTW